MRTFHRRLLSLDSRHFFIVPHFLCPFQRSCSIVAKFSPPLPAPLAAAISDVFPSKSASSISFAVSSFGCSTRHLIVQRESFQHLQHLLPPRLPTTRQASSYVVEICNKCLSAGIHNIKIGVKDLSRVPINFST